jgi:hypothetical protein
MPIILPEGLASAALLRGEGVDVRHRPLLHSSALRVGFLDLMPDMTRTEVQFARLLGATRHHVELVLALPASYRLGHEGTRLYARWGGLFGRSMLHASAGHARTVMDAEQDHGSLGRVSQCPTKPRRLLILRQASKAATHAGMNIHASRHTTNTA